MPVDKPDEELRAAQSLIEAAGVALASRHPQDASGSVAHVPLDFLVRLFARSAADGG